MLLTLVCTHLSGFKMPQTELIYNSWNIEPQDPIPTVRFGTNDYGYTVLNCGLIKQWNTGKSIALDDFHGRIEKFRIYHVDTTLYFVLNLTNGEDGCGGIIKIDEKQFKKIWSQEIPAFNIGEPYFEEFSVYVTGIGFIGKLDTKTGVYLWKHVDLYRGNHFNSFEKPFKHKGRIIFIENPIKNNKDNKYQIEINAVNGQYKIEKAERTAY